MTPPLSAVPTAVSGRRTVHRYHREPKLWGRGLEEVGHPFHFQSQNTETQTTQHSVTVRPGTAVRDSSICATGVETERSRRACSRAGALPSLALDPAMADTRPDVHTPLHPENMDATCSDVRELLAPTSFHVVHGGCASSRNVDRALIGQLSPLGKLSPTTES